MSNSETPLQKDVAREANVSPKTVSMALRKKRGVSESTRQKVYEAAERLDYRPDPYRNPRGRPSHAIIGVCVPDLEGAHYGELTHNLIKCAWSRNWVVVPQSTNDENADELRAAEMFKRLGVKAVILTSSRIGKEAIDMLEAEAIVVVSMVSLVPGVPGEDEALPSFSSCPLPLNHFEGTFKATEHLVSLGHQRIGYLAGPRNSSSDRAKYKGYKEALSRANLEATSDLVIRLDGEKYDYQAGSDACMELVVYRPHEYRPTAIVCYNDELAIGALACLRTNGIQVPAEISIVGNDDIKVTRFTEPPLTTIRVPRAHLAAQAVQMIEDYSKGLTHAKEREPVVPEWVPRASHAPPPERSL